jgi:hypothetical protein
LRVKHGSDLDFIAAQIARILVNTSDRSFITSV